MPKTFRFNVSFDATVVLPDDLLESVQDLREESRKGNVGPALKAMEAQHPDDDEAFLEKLIKANLRGFLKENVMEAGTTTAFSPAKVTRLDTPPVRQKEPSVVLEDFQKAAEVYRCENHPETCANPRCTVH